MIPNRRTMISDPGQPGPDSVEIEIDRVLTVRLYLAGERGLGVVLGGNPLPTRPAEVARRLVGIGRRGSLLGPRDFDHVSARHQTLVRGDGVLAALDRGP